MWNKAVEPIGYGCRHQHFKTWRWVKQEGTYILGNPKRAAKVLKELKMEACKPVGCPVVDETDTQFEEPAEEDDDEKAKEDKELEPNP